MAITPLTPPIARTSVDPSSEASVSAFVTSVENFYEEISTTFVTEVNATEDNMEALEASTQTAKTDAETAATAAQTAKGLAEEAATLAVNTVATLPNGSISDTTISTTQSYSSQKTEDRIMEAVAGVPTSFVIGDTITTASARTVPEWLKCDGSQFDPTVYTQLANVLTLKSTKLANPATMPTGIVYGVDIDTTDTYMAVANGGSSPYMTLYKRSGDVFTKLTNPSTLPSGQCNDASFTPSASHLAVSSNSSPYVLIYSRSGDTFTKLTNPATLPSSASQTAQFDSSGTYLAVGQNSGNMIIYKRAGDVFTSLATIPSISSVSSLAWSPDSVYLAVYTYNAIYILKRDGDTFTQLTSPATYPIFGTYTPKMRWSNDSVYLATGGTSPKVYKRTVDTLAELTIPTTTETVGAGWHPSDTYLTLGLKDSPYIKILKRDGDTFEVVANPATPPTSIGFSVEYSDDGNYLALGGALTIYKNGHFVPTVTNTDTVLTTYIKTGETA